MTGVARPGRRCATAALALLALAGCSLSQDPVEPDPDLPSTEIHGYLKLRTQAEVDAALGIRTIVGDLTIEGHDIENLAGLRTLRRVHGELRLLDCPLLEDVGELARLETADMLVLDGCDGLASLADLEHLDGCLELRLRHCVRLGNVPTGLAESARRVELADLPELASLAFLARTDSLVGLELRDLPAVREFGALAGLRFLQGLELSGLVIRELPDLGGVRWLKRLSLNHLDSLTSVAGAADLPHLEHLAINRCGALIDLDGLGNLPALTNFDLLFNRNLTSLDGLTALPAVRYVGIQYCDGLRTLSLPSMPSLVHLLVNGVYDLTSISVAEATELARLSVYSAYALEEIDLPAVGAGLDRLVLGSCHALRRVGGGVVAPHGTIDIHGCDALSDLDGLVVASDLATLALDHIGLPDLAAFAPVRAVDMLRLRRCGMRTLAGLEDLESIARGVSVDANASLVDVGALRGVRAAAPIYVRFSGNAKLDRCHIESVVGSWSGDVYAIDSENGPCAAPVERP